MGGILIAICIQLVEKGISIPMLSGDAFGLIDGLDLKADFLGNSIEGNPGIGAIQVSPALVEKINRSLETKDFSFQKSEKIELDDP